MINQVMFIVLALALIPGGAHARDTYKFYGEAPLGSKLRPVEAKSPIPFDKEYHQLTAEQKIIFRGLWEGLDRNDSPPFPKGGTRSLYAPIIKGHQRVARGGLLRLIAQIDETGAVEQVAVYNSPHDEMTELAQAVFFNTQFVPATCAGEPCAMDFPFEIELIKRAKQMNTLNSEDIPGISN